MEKGLTLIEILIVVVALGVLASIVIPQFVDSSDAGNLAKAQTDISTLNSVIEFWRAENGSYPKGNKFNKTAKKLVSGGFIKDIPEAPTGYTYRYRAKTGLFSFVQKKKKK